MREDVIIENAKIALLLLTKKPPCKAGPGVGMRNNPRNIFHSEQSYQTRFHAEPHAPWNRVERRYGFQYSHSRREDDQESSGNMYDERCVRSSGVL